ncbi:MAG: MFS transporter [Gemmatimonadaceae bacterium]
MSTAPPGRHDSYAAFRQRDFRSYLAGVIVSTLGSQMQDVAVGWQLYERTHSAMALGLVGLVQVIPVILLVLPAGHAADRFDRRRLLMLAEMVMAAAAIGLAVISFTGAPTPLIYGAMLLSGISRAFYGPARSSLLAQLVSRETFGSAVTWNSGGWQLASVAGPALGGAVIGLTRAATLAYVLNATAALSFVALLATIRSRAPARSQDVATWSTLIAGVRFVARTKTLLASITLDMFAVLLGGATTLLPMFAKDILHVGPSGLGWLLAAPSIGAFVMAMALAHRPPLRRAGPTLLWAVTGFGAATILFGLSRSYGLSLVALVLTGAFDNISVVVRSTLLQLLTPDDMRGRVSAVNSVFIGTSNELGGFESGAIAALFGPVFSVVAGGVGTIVVVLAVARHWPQVRGLGSLAELGKQEHPPPGSA